MDKHTYDWTVRMSEEATRCGHLAVAELGEQKGLDGKVVAILANCLKCSNTIALNTSDYRKTDRFLGDKPVYIRHLYKRKD